MDEQIRYRGSLTALLTMAGVAIGLGNVWRFPYMMGQNGGSAFLLVYLAILLAIAIPALAAEWALARHTRRGTAGTFGAIYRRPFGPLLGALLVFGTLMAVSYYLVVIGNVAYTAGFAILKGFTPDTADAFGRGLGDRPAQFGFAVAVLAWAGYVVYRGINRGIEAASRIFVPLFGLVILYLLVQTLRLDGSLGHLAAFLEPDFDRIGIREVFAATGQACFSLGIGGTLMLVYGSYLDDREHLFRKATLTALTDAGAAILAAAFIVPAVLVFGIGLASGPTLVFETLPQLFATMPGGRLAGGLFLGALTLMAFLSAVAGLQVCVRGAAHYTGDRLGKGGTVLAVVAVECVLMLLPAFRPQVIGTLDLIFGSGFLLFGCAMAVLGLAWCTGRDVLPTQFGGAATLLRPWLRFVVPAALLSVLALYVYDTAMGGGH